MNTTANRPARPAGELFLPTDISPEELFTALGRLRSEAEPEIERLIRIVDEIDGLDEREPDHDGEPSLAHTEAGQWSPSLPEGEEDFASTAGEDCRPESYRHCFVDGGEPSLAAPDSHPGCSPVRIGRNGPVYIDVSGRTTQGDQTNWCGGASDDREGDGCADDREDACEDEGAEHDGRDPEHDEPNLGWTEAFAQGNGNAGPSTDREDAASEVTKKARRRYQANRYRPRSDVHSEYQYAGARYIRGLTNGQRGRVRQRLVIGSDVFL